MTQTKELRAGSSVSVSRRIEEQDVVDFARISQDHNPIHFDEEFAAKTLFERPIAHGLISASLISGALTKLMGQGNIWLSAAIDFKKPAYIGDELKATLSIRELDRRGVAQLDVKVQNAAGDVVVAGTVKSMNFNRRRVK